ncbi:hypothetical protein CY35_02G096500 [Sphagnum magellanicum]|jgi:exo-beta-1,3-glucanase (GH17 family)|nr:hypothetical protein CY35_02G096500 [Sphagnum magellanicum]
MPPAPAALSRLLFLSVFRVVTCVSLVCLLSSSLADANSIGVVYGRNGNNLPTPQQAAQLMQDNVLTRVRIYDHDATVIQAFSLTQIRVIIGVTNDEIPNIANSQQVADSWIADNVAAYINLTNINAIAVGSDVLTAASNVSSFLVPAMQNLYNALVSQGMNLSVKVSTPMNLEILEVSYPPSAGVFYSSLVPVLQPMLAFLTATDSFFMLNVYPFLSYEYSPTSISLSYAMFNFTTGILDQGSNLTYYNLYDAQVDALISAMAALNYSSLTVTVTETGWPSTGALTESAAKFDNANAYLSNLVRITQTNAGTPLRPGQEIDAYIYDLYDEDLNVGQMSNRNYGLFYANGTSKYDINFVTGTVGGRSPSVPSSGPASGPASPGVASGQPPATPSDTLNWCVAKPSATNSSLQQGLDWACGPGLANCGPIQRGGACYLPNTLLSHASYAFNIHYHYFQTDSRSCIFGGDAELTNVDPSYGSCYYVASQATNVEGSRFTQCCRILLTFAVVTMVLFLTV